MRISDWSPDVCTSDLFSFFNAIAFNPCMVVLGVEARPDRRPKDTSANIRELPEFVVNIVDRTLADAMNLCALPLAPGQSEVDLAGLDTAASETVRPPRLAQARSEERPVGQGWVRKGSST